MAQSLSHAHVFRTTRWTMVLTAADLNDPDGEEALAKICQDYWLPLYSFVRRKGHPPQDTQDVLQAFFQQLLSRNFLSRADKERGRFRTFMLTVLGRFLNNHIKAQNRVKRGGQFTFIPLELDEAESYYRNEPSERHTPESLFERQWALSILKKAGRALELEYRKADKVALYETIQPYLTEPREAPPLAEAARSLCISHGAVRVALHRMRRHFGELIRREIADTVMDPKEVDEELRHLRHVLAH